MSNIDNREILEVRDFCCTSRGFLRRALIATQIKYKDIVECMNLL